MEETASEVNTVINEETNEVSSETSVNAWESNTSNGESGEHEVSSSGEDASLVVNTGNDSTRQFDLTSDSAKVALEENEDAEEEVSEKSNGHRNGVPNGSNGHHSDANGSSSQSEHTPPSWAAVVAGHPTVSSLVEEDSRSESSSVHESGDGVGRGGRKRTKSPRASPNKRQARDPEDVRPYACEVADCEWAFKALFHLNRHRKAVHHLDHLSAASYALIQEQRQEAALKDTSVNSGQSYSVDQDPNLLFENLLETGQY